jgi:outer membrane protein TolC
MKKFVQASLGELMRQKRFRWSIAKLMRACFDQALSCGLACTVALMLLGPAGCKRNFYRRTADRDVYCLVDEKGTGPNWDAAAQFSIEPDPQSRFYDPSCATDPTLPMPAPQLYNYSLPKLTTPPPPPRDLERLEDQAEKGDNNASPSASDLSNPNMDRSTRSSIDSDSATATLAAWTQQSAPDSEEVLPRPPVAGPPTLDEPLGQSPLPELGPVPAEAWASLPESCLRRMLEFDTVRDEYKLTFRKSVTEDQLDPAQRVNLQNILEIALINSREYQTRRETLYRVALRLSLQRFEYDLQFLSRGNGGSINYIHDRNGGVEVNRLTTPTGLGITRSLYTGGDLVARFANDVVLTFNGPAGYSSSIGSELFIDLFQPIMQRDVRFEPLTQAERDVVYAARDFVRFQKTLFRDLATQYYGLLLTYRSIAINTQDYFSNLREFNRAAATEQAGRIPLFQVDQFEQNVLRSRGNVINSCNTLEGTLDRLKVRIGLPTELPLNVALSELEELTLRDEASVLREQLDRKSRVFLQRQSSEGTSVALPALTEVARRLLSLAEVNKLLDYGQPQASEGPGIPALSILVALLEAEERRIEARQKNELLALNAQAGADEAQLLPAALFIRNKEVVMLTLESVRKELQLVRLVMQLDTQNSAIDESDSATSEDLQTALDRDALRAQFERFESLVERWQRDVELYNELDRKLVGIPFAEQAALLPELNIAAGQQLNMARALEEDILLVLEQYEIRFPQTAQELDSLVAEVLELRAKTPGEIGLAELEIDVDEAMLTALVQRLDLMNRRGQLADAWRQIKYAGDDLRSILNLRATQSIRTRAGSDNPFDFTFDDSTTRLSMNFDTPLNRRSERNIYRLTLINYNVALRNLIEAQDNVKLDIRDDLRAIELDRNQYEISIASAALAYDRVTSTRMQVALGQGNITARDFLEAQQDYTQSLSAVAQQHIGYIQDRIQLFLDLEQLQVNQVNFWPELRNESYPFMANTNFGSLTPDGYGSLPNGPWYSDCLRRMEQVPSGVSTIYTPYLPSTSSPAARAVE